MYKDSCAGCRKVIEPIREDLKRRFSEYALMDDTISEDSARKILLEMKPTFEINELLLNRYFNAEDEKPCITFAQFEDLLRVLDFPILMYSKLMRPQDILRNQNPIDIKIGIKPEKALDIKAQQGLDRRNGGHCSSCIMTNAEAQLNGKSHSIEPIDGTKYLLDAKLSF